MLRNNSYTDCRCHVLSAYEARTLHWVLYMQDLLNLILQTTLGPVSTLLSRIRLSVDSLSQWFSMVSFALELPAGLDKTPIIDSFPWSIWFRGSELWAEIFIPKIPSLLLLLLLLSWGHIWKSLVSVTFRVCCYCYLVLSHVPLCSPMDCRSQLPGLHYLLEFSQSSLSTELIMFI